MEHSTWARFIGFVKYCYAEKFKAAFKGCFLGLCGSVPLFWSGPLAGPLVIYFLKGIGTLLFTGATTLISCWVTYKFDKWKEKKTPSPIEKRKNNRAA